jgi:hypothetical protein
MPSPGKGDNKNVKGVPKDSSPYTCLPAHGGLFFRNALVLTALSSF